MFHQIKGYTYYPNSSLEQTLAAFMQAQERVLSDALVVKIFLTGEDMSDLSKRMELQMIKHFRSTPDMVRRVVIEYDDGYIYQLYLVNLAENSWYVALAELLLKIKW